MTVRTDEGTEYPTSYPYAKKHNRNGVYLGTNPQSFGPKK